LFDRVFRGEGGAAAVSLIYKPGLATIALARQSADIREDSHRPFAAGATLSIPFLPPGQLGNRGGMIALLDDRGLKVDGVSYTEGEAQREGWTLVC
jgi:hypothetical protein